MSIKIFLAVLGAAVLSPGAFAKVIYGDDHRQEISEATPFQQRLARAAATMISENKMTRDLSRPGLVQFSQKTLREWLESPDDEEADKQIGRYSSKLREAVDQGVSFCSDERFIEQPNPGMCSGFLIGPDLLVTAGHCVELENFCAEYRWVFDFKVNSQTQKAGVDIKEEDIYQCKRVVSGTLAMPLNLDYAVIQLDRKVKGREPLEIRSDTLIENETPLFVVGSPSGLPLKVTSGGNVRDNLHPYFFSANLDTFQGNSGSGVFNALTGVIEGILVRGEEDFEVNNEKKCIQAKRCKDNECRGEDITRLSAIPEVGLKDIFQEAATSGDLNTIHVILKMNVWIDFYGKDGVSALMSSVIHKQEAVMDLLLEKGADIGLQDSMGNSSLHHLAKSLDETSLNMLNKILVAKAKLELKNDAGDTALIAAAKSNNFYAVKSLVEAGADINAVDNKGESAIFAFARNKNTDDARRMIAMGANRHLQNAKGQTVHDIRNAKGKKFMPKTLNEFFDFERNNSPVARIP